MGCAGGTARNIPSQLKSTEWRHFSSYDVEQNGCQKQKKDLKLCKKVNYDTIIV